MKEPNGIGPCGEEEIRTAFGAGMWGGKLPSTGEPIDAEMYAILAYLRKMASAIRVGELQEDPLTRFLLRYDEFEPRGES